MRCADCGTELILSSGWVPSYNDPDNAGLAPMAEPFCPKCEVELPITDYLLSVMREADLLEELVQLKMENPGVTREAALEWAVEMRERYGVKGK